MKDYKEIWNNLSTTLADASFNVGCLRTEEETRSNGVITANFLREVLQIGPTDRVLDIGCGVARVGHELAPSCGEWHGCDISGNMIAYARQRTEGMPNVYLHELPDSTLRIFRDNSFDCVYCTIVLLHLDKPNMFTYLREAYRVLKPGGRAYFDTWNILAPDAWPQFLRIVELFPTGLPGHISQFSTPQEMQKFMDEVGFETVHIDGDGPQLVIALGRKSLQSPAADHEGADTSSELGPVLVAAPGANGASAADESAPAVALAAQEDSPSEVLAHQQAELEARQEYIERLEATLADKNAALTDLSARYRRLEQELLAARTPRLPWLRS